MQYKPLGQTGLQVSQLCFGTMSFGGDADEAESAKMFHACRDIGINFFDCADAYSKGKAETILGKLIKDCRDEIVLTSKCFIQMDDNVLSGGAGRRHIIQACEASLKRLGTDYLDVFGNVWMLFSPCIHSSNARLKWKFLNLPKLKILE
jgi:aryl-alcohol dehydrogenase-like predicted oxidoreductase